MPCITAGKPTALERYARSLATVDDAAAMLFPMYTVAVEALLKMTRLKPHEELKARHRMASCSYKGVF